MKVEEFIHELSTGMLSNLAMGNDGEGVICDKYLGKLVRYVNQGLTRLHGLFALKSLLTTLPVTMGVSEYLPDIPRTLTISRIFSQEDQAFLPINAENSQHGVLVGSDFKITYVVPPVKDDVLILHRHLNHNEVTLASLGQVLAIPDVLLEALELFVIYKVYREINTVEAQGISKQHEASFLSLVQSIQAGDLVSDSLISHSSKFSGRGWV